MRRRKVYSQALKKLRKILYKKPILAVVERAHPPKFKHLVNVTRKMHKRVDYPQVGMIQGGFFKIKGKKRFSVSRAIDLGKTDSGYTHRATAAKISGLPLSFPRDVLKSLKKHKLIFNKKIIRKDPHPYIREYNVMRVTEPKKIEILEIRELQKLNKLLRSKRGKQYLNYLSAKKVRRLKFKKFDKLGHREALKGLKGSDKEGFGEKYSKQIRNYYRGIKKYSKSGQRKRVGDI